MTKLGNIEVETEVAQVKFLEQYCLTPTIKKTCEVLGLSQRTVYHWRVGNKKFAEEFGKLQTLVLQFLEDAAYIRAVEGVEKPVYQNGEKVGTIIEYSDALLALLLRANAPHKYGNKTIGDGVLDALGNVIQQEVNIIHIHSNVPLSNSEDDVLLQLPLPVSMESKLNP